MIKKISLACIGFFMATPSFAQKLDTLKLSQYFDTLAHHNKFMGSVAIAQNDKIVYSKAVGMADIDKNIKATTNTKYRIGSISKTFTATLILKAVEEKKLQLDQTLDKWFPDILNSNKISITNLLNHSSGIYDITNSAAYLTWYTNPQTEANLIDYIKKGGSNFEPNSQNEYSNSNYILLTFILEKIYQKPFAQLLAAKIVKPFGLKNTYLGGKINTANQEALSYGFNDNKWQISDETDMSIPLGAGAVVSNPTDLIKFSTALFNEKIISGTSLKQMQTMNNNFGLGLFEIPFNKELGYGHNGGIDDFTSIFGYYPNSKYAYAITANGGDYSNDKILITLLLASENKPIEIPTFESVIQLTEAELAIFEGVYSTTQIPIKITISQKNAQLIAQADGQSSFPLEAIAKNKFQFTLADIVLEFNDSEKQMSLKQNGATYIFTKQ